MKGEDMSKHVCEYSYPLCPDLLAEVERLKAEKAPIRVVLKEPGKSVMDLIPSRAGTFDFDAYERRLDEARAEVERLNNHTERLRASKYLLIETHEKTKEALKATERDWHKAMDQRDEAYAALRLAHPIFQHRWPDPVVRAQVLEVLNSPGMNAAMAAKGEGET